MAMKYGQKDRDKPVFYDRHPLVFLTVLDYYRTGELHYPMTVCGAVVKRELDYWGIPQRKMQPCCVTNFSAYFTSSRICINESQHTKSNDLLKKSKSARTSWKRLQYKMTYLFENPTASCAALVTALISYMAVMVSIVTLCLESMEQFQVSSTNLTVVCPNKPMTSDHDDHQTILAEDSVLKYIDTACAIYFSIELFVRFIAAPVKRKFLTKILTIVDILALLPSYVHFMLHIIGIKIVCEHKDIIEFLHVVSVLRMLRVFRTFHLLRHYGPFHILIYTLRNAGRVIFMLSVFMIIAVLVLGNLIYFLEMPRNSKTESNTSQIKNIPEGFWWAIVTMTTLGYGDKIPSTLIGYSIGGLAAVVGVILISFIVPILSNIFNMAYNFQMASNIVYHDRRSERNVLVEWRNFCRQKYERYKCNSSEPPDSTTIEETERIKPTPENNGYKYQQRDDNKNCTKTEAVEMLFNDGDMPESSV
ncbi:voltage-gated potassium channel KCNC2-like [Tubulanus polymorphus]|uniref:voltage-gated potassium channel KCNC2-like n=1 Tax=Tubulanus polymorphus TaxID=672921 RepID=UPI003DA4173E